jgi:hypothetical protein
MITTIFEEKYFIRRRQVLPELVRRIGNVAVREKILSLCHCLSVNSRPVLYVRFFINRLRADIGFIITSRKIKNKIGYEVGSNKK